MRTFPLADPLGVMENIGDKLYKIMESGEGNTVNRFYKTLD